MQDHQRSKKATEGLVQQAVWHKAGEVLRINSSAKMPPPRQALKRYEKFQSELANRIIIKNYSNENTK